MENYKPNSHKSKEHSAITEKKKVEKVVSGKARLQQKSGARKFADVFVSKDAADVKSYIFADVLVPAVKKLITDIVKDGIDMVLYGGVRGESSRGIRADYVSYSRYSDRRDNRSSHSDSRSINKPEYVVLESKGEALYVIEQMEALIDEYKIVTVADMYDLVGIEHSYTDNKYGWTNIRNAKPVRLRDGGYAIDLPKAVPID